MRRLDFIAGAAGTLASGTNSPSAGAQQPSLPIVGFINSRSLGEAAASVEAFRKGLAGGGFVEGRNVAIEFRWAEGRIETLAQHATDLNLKTAAALCLTFPDKVLALADEVIE